MSRPILDATLASTLIVDTSMSPGVVTLTGHDREWAWDVQKAQGQTGATSKMTGDEIVEFQASFFLASPEDQIAWAPFQRVLESAVIPSAKSLPVYHPDLARNRIVEVSVKMIGGFIRDDRGGVTVQVTFIECRPPKPKKVTGTTGKGNEGVPPGNGGEDSYDPNAERKRELDDLINSLDEP